MNNRTCWTCCIDSLLLSFLYYVKQGGVLTCWAFFRVVVFHVGWCWLFSLVIEARNFFMRFCHCCKSFFWNIVNRWCAVNILHASPGARPLARVGPLIQLAKLELARIKGAVITAHDKHKAGRAREGINRNHENTLKDPLRHCKVFFQLLQSIFSGLNTSSKANLSYNHVPLQSFANYCKQSKAPRWKDSRK